MSILRYYKKYGETLAVMLERFRNENPIYEQEKVTYAGRLDPMASGEMLLLTGEDVFRKDYFLGKDKVYEVDFILGIDTDTYDILGLPTGQIDETFSVKHDFSKYDFSQYACVFEQEYPPFSSRRVQGKPLFLWSKEGRIHDIEIPKKEVEIYNVQYLGSVFLDFNTFENQVLDSVSAVVGDFRQDKILCRWKSVFGKYSVNNISIHRVRIDASSGVYVRSLVHRVGLDLGCGATCLHIRRISIKGV